ncbi:hypothetical protein [Sneathiella chinensis]|uniref:Uncharacterized protein n=1 Tax=Sneathiella chinensis TaxID=349750 RepID=A0ABQ5U4U4_9PROT|nr:hypothetical protein [Sneathiella chinensis]GLQ06766.1 hypothetical protein GCM10007924_19870 [Sneathiella chinensis]
MRNETDWDALLTEMQSVVPDLTISPSEWETMEAETPPYQLWFIIAAAIFFAVTMVYGCQRNREEATIAPRWLRQLNIAQGHYSGFLLGHILREALKASGAGTPQIERILHIATIPANMAIAMGTGFPFSPLVAGPGDEGADVLAGLPTYNLNGASQVQLMILYKAMTQALVALVSYAGLGNQAPSTVYPALALGEFLYMVSRRQRGAAAPLPIWAGESEEIRNRLETGPVNLLYGLPGAVGSTFLVGGMWQGYSSTPPEDYWGHEWGLASGPLGIGWNVLTMIAVEEIIYLGWIGAQYLGYRAFRTPAGERQQSGVEIEEVRDE